MCQATETYETGTVTAFLFIRDGNSVVCVTVFPTDTVISTRLPDSAFIFYLDNY